MTENDKTLINLRFLQFSMNELRKHFSEAELNKVDQQAVLGLISEGATLTELRLRITEMIIAPPVVSNKRIVL